MHNIFEFCTLGQIVFTCFDFLVHLDELFIMDIQQIIRLTFRSKGYKS